MTHDIYAKCKHQLVNVITMVVDANAFLVESLKIKLLDFMYGIEERFIIVKIIANKAAAYQNFAAFVYEGSASRLNRNMCVYKSVQKTIDHKFLYNQISVSD